MPLAHVQSFISQNLLFASRSPRTLPGSLLAAIQALDSFGTGRFPLRSEENISRQLEIDCWPERS